MFVCAPGVRAGFLLASGFLRWIRWVRTTKPGRSRVALAAGSGAGRRETMGVDMQCAACAWVVPGVRVRASEGLRAGVAGRTARAVDGVPSLLRALQARTPVVHTASAAQCRAGGACQRGPCVPAPPPWSSISRAAAAGGASTPASLVQLTPASTQARTHARCRARGPGCGSGRLAGPQRQQQLQQLQQVRLSCAGQWPDASGGGGGITRAPWL